jgi:hypothetical protein
MNEEQTNTLSGHIQKTVYKTREMYADISRADIERCSPGEPVLDIASRLAWRSHCLVTEISQGSEMSQDLFRFYRDDMRLPYYAFCQPD